MGNAVDFSQNANFDVLSFNKSVNLDQIILLLICWYIISARAKFSLGVALAPKDLIRVSALT